MKLNVQIRDLEIVRRQRRIDVVPLHQVHCHTARERLERSARTERLFGERGADLDAVDAGAVKRFAWDRRRKADLRGHGSLPGRVRRIPARADDLFEPSNSVVRDGEHCAFARQRPNGGIVWRGRDGRDDWHLKLIEDWCIGRVGF